MQYLTIWDLVLTPVYLLVLGLIAKRHRDKKYSLGHPLRRYYLPGLYIKFGGAIFIALVYQYYYKGGDTFIYFMHSKIINSSLKDSINTWFDLITRTPFTDNPKVYNYAVQMEWYVDRSTYTVASLGAIFGLLNGTTYLPIALLFAFFSYTGLWAMYRTFTNIYPNLYRQLAIPFLFIPSIAVWGSAIFKDTVCMFGLGWVTYCTFRIFVNRDFSIKNIALLLLSFYLVALIKIYILLAFLPALSLWLLMTYSKRIKMAVIRWFMNIAFIAVVVAGFFYFANRFAKELNKYSLENITKTAEVTRSWIAYSSGEEGSAYSLGEMDGTIEGLLLKAPAGVVVTLFRPFLWEVKKIIVGLSALESFLFLSGTLLVVFRTGFFSFFRKIFTNPNLTFFFTFSLIFAFAVGVSSYNFGALSRYKIPCLPFYAALLIVLYYSKSTKNKMDVQKVNWRQGRPVLINT
ncbi:MAG: hypothetical protein ICV79_17295 [Flavisolibacter sp.]|nr:hypothetical protein [Flavisolibacter sp.]